MKQIRYHVPLTHTRAELAGWLAESGAEDGECGSFSGHGRRFRDLTHGDSSLAVDLFEGPSAYQACFELPGVPREALRVSLEPSQVLWVRFERRAVAESGAAHAVVARASRRLPLPADAHPAHVRAKLENGLLTVTIPKAPVARRARFAASRPRAQAASPASDTAFLKPRHMAECGPHGDALRVFVPGVDEAGLVIALDARKRVFTVTARRRPGPPRGWKPLRFELRRGDFRLQVKARSGIDPDRILARLENGLLDVMLPFRRPSRQLIDLPTT